MCVSLFLSLYHPQHDLATPLTLVESSNAINIIIYIGKTSKQGEQLKKDHHLHHSLYIYIANISDIPYIHALNNKHI